MDKKLKLIIWLPFAIGILLLVVVKIDLIQFNSQSINPRTMAAREIPIVILGVIVSALVSICSIYWFCKKQWAIATQSIISPVLFIICFIFGGVMGGAFLNAT